MTRKNIDKFVLLLFALSSCSDSTTILKGHDFNSGDWLLVNTNGAERTIKVIDDEVVLLNNPMGIKVNWSEEHAYTTCDGILRLFKNGELVVQQDYLEQSHLTESESIKASYKDALDGSIDPTDESDFTKKWDSLQAIEHCYPTRYHTQPADKDVIWFYKYD